MHPDEYPQPVERRPVLYALGVLASVLWLFAGALAGLSLALHADGDNTYRTSVGTVDVGVRPAERGTVRARVPVTGWSATVHPFKIPVRIDIAMRRIDNEALGRLLSEGDLPATKVSELQDEGDRIARTAMFRAARVAATGAVGGGLLAGALLAALVYRRRLLWAGAIAGVMTAAVLVQWARVSLDQVDIDNRVVEPAAEQLGVAVLSECLREQSPWCPASTAPPALQPD